MNSQVITGIFTLLGVGVGALLSLAGVWYTQWQQAKQQQAQREREQEREHLSDARALRDAKRERLRELYAPILAAAWSMNDVPIEDKYTYRQETPEQKKERLEQWHQRTRKDVDECLLKLALERDATGVREIFDNLRKTYDRWRSTRYMFDNPHDVEWNSVHQLEAELRVLVINLEATVREQLAELEQPLPVLPSSTSPPPRRP